MGTVAYCCDIYCVGFYYWCYGYVGIFYFIGDVTKMTEEKLCLCCVCNKPIHIDEYGGESARGSLHVKCIPEYERITRKVSQGDE